MGVLCGRPCQEGVILLCKVDEVVLGVARHSSINLTLSSTSLVLCGVDFHMCVVKF